MTGTMTAFVVALAVASPPPSPRPAVFELRLAFREPAEGRRPYPCPPATCRPPKTDDTMYVSDAAILSTADVSSVNQVLEGDDHGIELHVRPQAAKSLGAVTGDHIGQPIAMFIDGRLHSAPTLTSRLGDVIWVNGAFSDEELAAPARRVASELGR